MTKSHHSKTEDLKEKEIDRLLHGDSVGSLEIWRKILEIVYDLQDDIHKIQISAASIPKEIREVRELFSRIERQGGFR